ncbi:MAG: S8/S53 family peptidase [Bacteroidetes bacterium]|nr:S8/S53 family peptidase [Bacteroidota bacterium]
MSKPIVLLVHGMGIYALNDIKEEFLKFFEGMSRRLILLSIILLFLAGCVEESSKYLIDVTLEPPYATIEGFDQGEKRPIGVVVSPDGSRAEFVSNEVVIDSLDPANLAVFLNLYNGVVLRGRDPIEVDGFQTRGSWEDFPSGPLLVRIDLGSINTGDFKEAMSKLEIEGTFKFSSEEAVKLMTLVSLEDRFNIAPNFLMEDDSSREHPNNSGGFYNTSENEFWHLMSPYLETNITLAWDYLRYLCLPLCEDGVWEPGIVAVIDRGFNLDKQTGVPLAEGGPDYVFTGNKPLQLDVVDNDGTAGGKSNNSSKPWHGQAAFGVCCAKPGNSYGGAGTGGNLVRPMLVRKSWSLFETADGIRQATFYGADVINVSSGFTCRWGMCKTPAYNAEQALQQAIDTAAAFGVPVVASAGNDKDDLSGGSRIPCTLRNVICVGAMNDLKENLYNFGTPVDIWAPTRILSTVTPKSAAIDTDDVGLDEIKRFGGTSAATPFVSGVIGLLKTYDKNQTESYLNCDKLCTHAQILAVLQDTANQSSTDPQVSKGYVDALAALMVLKANQAPTVVVTKPLDGDTRSWNGVSLFAEMTDSEPGHELPMFKDNYLVNFVSNIEGDLCTAQILGDYIDPAPLPEMRCRTVFTQLGDHQITATGVDPFGATATASLNLTIVNSAPSISVIQPSLGSIFTTQDIIGFSATVADQDEGINDLTIVWRNGSDELSDVGTFGTNLPQGVHTISVEVTDTFGEVDTDSIVVQVVSGYSFPTLNIISPQSVIFGPGVIIQFSAESTDVEDGDLGGSSIVWSSDRDGVLGTGTNLSVGLSGPSQACNPSTINHKITATATDTDGNATSMIITVRVGVIC